MNVLRTLWWTIKDTWPLWIVCLVVIIGLSVLGNTAFGDEVRSSVRGTTDSGHIRLKKTHANGVTTTRGEINGRLVRTKTIQTPTGTKTTGTVGSELIRVKTKKK